MPTGTPALASPTRISFRVMSDVRATRPRISEACASIRSERRSPPSALGATEPVSRSRAHQRIALDALTPNRAAARSEEHTSELQSRQYLVCRLLLEKKKKSTYKVFV